MNKNIDNIDDTFNVVAGKVIKKYREKKGMSLDRVASKMKNPVTKQSLHKYENNMARMKNSVFLDICDAIGIDPNEVWEEINSSALYINLQKSGYNNDNIMTQIKPDNELLSLLNENKDILTDSDKAIIKTIIEERKKETEKEN